MTARGDARKRLIEELAASIEPAYDEHADILAELAETQAALHAATNDVVRLAAELHTAHGQVDRVRALIMRMQDMADVSIDPDNREYLGAFANTLAAALDGGAS